MGERCNQCLTVYAYKPCAFCRKRITLPLDSRRRYCDDKCKGREYRRRKKAEKEQKAAEQKAAT